MTDHAISHQSPAAVWRRPEVLLVVLGFLGFVTLPIRITTIYSNLPAHPLFVHVPVVLIPVTIVAAIACVLRPQWFRRYGIALAVVSIVAMSSIFLAMQAGAALRGELDLTGSAAHLISEHSQAAHILAIVYVAFTAVLILALTAQRIVDGAPFGVRVLDSVLGRPIVAVSLRGLMLVLALAAVVMVVRVGDLGAKAVWQGRLHASAMVDGARHGALRGPTISAAGGSIASRRPD